MRRSVRGLVVPLILALGTATAAPERKQPTSAQDLQYGETLFYYFQEDWFNSIIRLQIAREQNRLSYHRDEAELLLGGLDLSYGLRNEASRIFGEMLADSETDEQTRNRAWFYLAKISYQRGDPLDALQALSRVSGDMTQATRIEATQLHSVLLLELGQSEAAIKVLEPAKRSGSWTPYLAYNLGVAYLRNDELESGARELASIDDMSGSSEEIRLLRDKANLALGYSYLQAGVRDESRKSLDRVRLEGPFSNKALLGAGWADAEADRFGQALVPWSELGRRELTDPAVQEVLLAMPYAMTRLSLHGRAVQLYNDAIEILYNEKGRLDDSITAIKDGDLLVLLEKQDLRSGTGWLQQLTLDTQSPALRYQVALMAAHSFQEAVKNYRDLLILRNNLQSWSESIDAYDDMLSARRLRYGENRPAALRALRSDDHNQLERRLLDLRERLSSIEVKDDPVALANAAELLQWNKITTLNEKIDKLPVNPESRVLHERITRLKGTLYWNLSSVYKQRLWQAKGQLSAISRQLDTSTQALQSLDTARVTTPAGFEVFRQRTDANRELIQALLTRTETLRHTQGERIEELAVAELEGQKKRIDTYIVQARFSLAQTFDSALHAEKGAMR